MYASDWPSFFRQQMPRCEGLHWSRKGGLFAVLDREAREADFARWRVSTSGPYRIYHLQPQWVMELEADLPQSHHARTRTLASLIGRSALMEDVGIVESAVLCLALHQPPEQRILALRRRAAVAMRSEGGGGLCLASVILEDAADW